MSEALYQRSPPCGDAVSTTRRGKLEELRGRDLGSARRARKALVREPARRSGGSSGEVRTARRRSGGATARVEEGARLFAMALHALSGAPDDAERIDLLLLLGDAQGRAGIRPRRRRRSSRRPTPTPAARHGTIRGERSATAGASCGCEPDPTRGSSRCCTRRSPLSPRVTARSRVRLLACLAGARREPLGHEATRTSSSAEAVRLPRASVTRQRRPTRRSRVRWPSGAAAHSRCGCWLSRRSHRRRRRRSGARRRRTAQPVAEHLRDGSA